MSLMSQDLDNGIQMGTIKNACKGRFFLSITELFILIQKNINFFQKRC